MFVVNGRFLTQKPTGVHRYAFEICNKLYEMGVDFHVAIPQEINPDYKFEFKTVKTGVFKTHLWEQICLPKYLRSIGKPLLVSFSGSGVFNYKNQIITIHDVSHELHPEWFSRSYCYYYGFTLPRIAKKAHAIITVSEFSKCEIMNTFGINAHKIVVIPGSLPIGSEPLKEETTEATKEENTEKYVLTVSSMDPRKNFIRLVDAFNRMEDKTIKLYIVGMQFKAFNTPDLKKMIGKNVVLTGYLSDEELREMYRKALFFIYPSLYEGFGMPPLEAMSFGCPVIASDIPAIREISGNAALYVNPTNVTDMAEKMNLMAKNEGLREDLTQRGFEQIKKYSWEKTAKQVYELAQHYL